MALDARELVAGLAGELGEVDRSGPEGATGAEEHSRQGSAFARVTPDALEVRLPEDIAEAALRTPDTSAVAGRPGWVRFSPASDERHARDRAEAWYRTAWRHAEARRRG